jgi:hypothetical protein
MADRPLHARGMAALARLVPPDATSPETDYLRTYLSKATLSGWDEPLSELERLLRLQPIESMAVAIAAAVETDPMAGRAVAYLQSPLGGSRPTLGLLAAAFTPLGDHVPERLLSGAAIHCGLLQLLNENAPLTERSIAVPLPVCLALSGQDVVWPGASIGLEGIPETPLPPSVINEARRQARGLSAGGQRVLVLRGNSQAELQTVARQVAQALSKEALFLNWHNKPNLTGLAPYLHLRGLLPVFSMDLAPGERVKLPELPGYDGSILVLCRAEGSVELHGDTALSWKIGTASQHERQTLWKTALGKPELARRLASGYRHGSGRIAYLGRLAQHLRTLDGRSQPSFADIAAASWTVEGPGLETLAQPIADAIPEDAFVMTPALREEMRRLVLRCLTRENLVHDLGASAVARFRPGVKALFTGPSGTGKTLAAAWLATRLGLPLYRVDLASVTSKYIGETEKNLAQLLGRAEESEVILLFDEADSLFGKRTEVKESNDRFANAQTNYLLQRIETFEGIALLTSNSRSRFDPAFCRRLDMIVDFPLPGPQERRDLWLSHLGKHHQLTGRELNQLAASVDLAGGHIRNAVLAAAVLARNARRTIVYQDVVVALGDEYRKLSRQLPAELLREE